MSETSVLDYLAKVNAMVWPMQVVAYVLCFIALFLAFKKSKHAGRIIAAILAFFWLWDGLVFLLPVGAALALFYVLGALFVVQGILFLIGVIRPNVSYHIGTDIYSLVGIVLVLYGLIGSPLVSMLIGHVYPKMPLVGLFPGPTLPFTFGMLLCTNAKVPKYLLVIPFLSGLWGVTDLAVGIWENAGAVVSALLATALIVYRDRH